ncbi:hypothetical protein PAA26_00395 [Methanomassiliicoccaceae archaeon COG_1]|nr:hypothetical protein [Methanomassiliicoccaceae archaeon COG_1]
MKLLEKDVPEVVREPRMSYETLWNSESLRPVNQKEPCGDRIRARTPRNVIKW